MNRISTVLLKLYLWNRVSCQKNRKQKIGITLLDRPSQNPNWLFIFTISIVAGIKNTQEA
jgi:hypothetical protein